MRRTVIDLHARLIIEMCFDALDASGITPAEVDLFYPALTSTIQETRKGYAKANNISKEDEWLIISHAIEILKEGYAGKTQD